LREKETTRITTYLDTKKMMKKAKIGHRKFNVELRDNMIKESLRGGDENNFINV
jgi:hypothetical protein